jgi:hypothetical protein
VGPLDGLGDEQVVGMDFVKAKLIDPVSHVL